MAPSSLPCLISYTATHAPKLVDTSTTRKTQAYPNGRPYNKIHHHFKHSHLIAIPLQSQPAPLRWSLGCLPVSWRSLQLAGSLLGRPTTQCSALKGNPGQEWLHLKDSTESGKLGTPELGACCFFFDFEMLLLLQYCSAHKREQILT